MHNWKRFRAKNDAEVIIKNGTFKVQIYSQIRTVSRWKIVLQMRSNRKVQSKIAFLSKFVQLRLASCWVKINFAIFC